MKPIDSPPEPPEASRTAVADAGEWLYRRFYRRVLGYFRHKGCPEEEARDLTQETFTRVYERVDRLRLDLHKAGPWVLTEADNVFKNEIRRREAEKRRGDEASRGKPLVRLVPLAGDEVVDLTGSVTYDSEEDLLSPAAEIWDADR